MPTSICNLDASCEIKLKIIIYATNLIFHVFMKILSKFTWNWQNIFNQECR